MVAMPPTGSQPSFTENSTISRMPSQKLGAAKKNMANTETRLSQIAHLHRGDDASAAADHERQAMLDTISSRVVGRCTEIASITGMFWR
jgi:hypothetical protein